MAKEKEVSKDVPPVEKGVEAPVKEQIEKKVEAAEKKIESATGERENIINYVPKARPDDPDFDLKQWAKALDQKVDLLISKHKEKEGTPIPTPEPPQKRVPWYDREII